MARCTIIDDDAELTEHTAAILTREGHTVTTLSTTEGAVDALMRDKPDILILDVMFPDNPMGGFQLARDIRRNRAIRNLPIILLSDINRELSLDFSADDIDPSWIPVQDFVPKPVNAKRLLDVVRKMLPRA
jgi:DNA-binding response OmpR family regulator